MLESTVKDELKSFFRISMARMTGDQSKVTTARNYKKSTHGLKSAINSKQGDLDDSEERLEELKEALVQVAHPKDLIEDRKTYVDSLLEVQNDIVAQEELIKTIKATLVFLKEQRASFDKVSEE